MNHYSLDKWLLLDSPQLQGLFAPIYRGGPRLGGQLDMWINAYRKQ
jgi:hypothetical protein